MAQLGPSPLEAFQIGQNLNGPSAMGTFAMQLTKQIQEMGLVHAKAQAESDVAIAQKKSLGPFDVAQAGKVAKAEAQGTMEGIRGSGAAGTGAAMTGKFKGIDISTPEEAASREATIDLVKERMKSEANIPAAIRDLHTLNQQFDAAFPATKGHEHEPAYQRASGYMSKIGVKFGIPRPTPAQTGLLVSMPLAGIGLVRLAGALGRVTNLELQGAEQTLNQQGLTPAERFQVAKALTKQYLARMAPGDFERIAKDNPDLPAIFKEYGIDIPTGVAGGPSDFSSTPSIQEQAKQELARRRAGAH